MTREKINRINQLAQLAKTRELSSEECTERDSLRQEYIKSVRQSLTSQLDQTYLVGEDGTHQKLEKKKQQED